MTSEVRVTDPTTGGMKGQKDERFDLIPYDALEEVARVYGVGARKYADDNWLKGYRWRLSAGALLRHVARWMIGEDRDTETGCYHLAHAAWHCLTLLTFAMRRLGTDDRAPVRAPVSINGIPIGTPVYDGPGAPVGHTTGPAYYIPAAPWTFDLEGEADLDELDAPIPVVPVYPAFDHGACGAGGGDDGPATDRLPPRSGAV